MSNAKDLEKLVKMTLNHYGRVDDAVNSFGDSPRPEAIAPIFYKICVKGQSGEEYVLALALALLQSGFDSPIYPNCEATASA